MEIIIVDVLHPLQIFNVKLVWFFDILVSLFSFVSFLKIEKWINKIGGLEIGEQTILINFYNSLTSNGSLNWNLSIDLCDQTGVVCDSSTPKRVIQLYSFFFSFLFLNHWMKTINNKNQIEIWEIKGFKDQFQPNF